MNQINPELQSQVEQLAKYCGETLNGNDVEFMVVTQPLIEALVLGGYDRLSNLPLANRVEEEVVDRYDELVIHRRAQLRSMCNKLQEAFEERKRWHASGPSDRVPSRPANISSVTDA